MEGRALKAEIASLRQGIEQLQTEINAINESLARAWRGLLSMPSTVVFEQLSQRLTAIEKELRTHEGLINKCPNRFDPASR